MTLGPRGVEKASDVSEVYWKDVPASGTTIIEDLSKLGVSHGKQSSKRDAAVYSQAHYHP
jgi:hypothetical protein